MVQAMACRLFSAKPLLEPEVTQYQLNKEQTSVNF